jgi:hypothetical protein
LVEIEATALASRRPFESQAILIDIYRRIGVALVHYRRPEIVILIRMSEGLC